MFTYNLLSVAFVHGLIWLKKIVILKEHGMSVKNTKVKMWKRLIVLRQVVGPCMRFYPDFTFNVRTYFLN